MHKHIPYEMLNHIAYTIVSIIWLVNEHKYSFQKANLKDIFGAPANYTSNAKCI